MLPEHPYRLPAPRRYSGLPSIRLKLERHRYHHGSESGEEVRLVLSFLIHGKPRVSYPKVTGSERARDLKGDVMSSEPTGSTTTTTTTTEVKLFVGIGKTVTTQTWPPPAPVGAASALQKGP
jgi:hypothetical protein